MPDKCLPTPAALRQILDYDAATGQFIWMRRNNPRWDAINAGNVAFNVNVSGGYKGGHVGGTMMLAHRVAWAMHYGEWPEGQIDHVNGDRADNRIANLRVVNNAENSKNQKIPKSNKSGFIGVSWDAARQRWKASIKVDGRSKHLGNFLEKSDAVSARKLAEAVYGFHCNHGRAAEELDAA